MIPAPGMALTESIRLVSKLGEGGMGAVWVAEHATLQRRVAVKLISATSASKEMLERFKREAGASGAINSPHVVQVFDHGLTADGTPYIVMELLEGEGLERRMRRDHVLDPRSVALVVAQTAHVLGKAHALGVVHRDIKPANLFLIESGYGLFVKVLDFGIAKQVDAFRDVSITSTGAMLGSPLYMSPEQFASAKTVDGRTDLWSLAVVAYEALTGAPPFGGDSLGQVMMAVLKRDFRRPGERRQDLSTFDAFFTKAFAEHIEERFQTAGELIAAFPGTESSTVTTASGPAPLGAPGRPAAIGEASSLGSTMMLDAPDGRGSTPPLAGAIVPQLVASTPLGSRADASASVAAASALTGQPTAGRTFAGAASTVHGVGRGSGRTWLVAALALGVAGAVVGVVVLQLPGAAVQPPRDERAAASIGQGAESTPPPLGIEPAQSAPSRADPPIAPPASAAAADASAAASSPSATAAVSGRSWPRPPTEVSGPRPSASIPTAAAASTKAPPAATTAETNYGF